MTLGTRNSTKSTWGNYFGKFNMAVFLDHEKMGGEIMHMPDSPGNGPILGLIVVFSKCLSVSFYYTFYVGRMCDI